MTFNANIAGAQPRALPAGEMSDAELLAAIARHLRCAQDLAAGIDHGGTRGLLLGALAAAAHSVKVRRAQS